MEKILIPERKAYKANLHCHTTDSDGKMTPEEVKEYYKSHGYSVLAYTDHVLMRDRTYLNDENFVAISGYENYVYQHGVIGIDVGSIHFNFYSPKPDKVGMVGIDDFFYRYYTRNKTDEEISRFPLYNGFGSNAYTVENINDIIAKANELGFLVVYNHPVWSRVTPDMFLGIKGLTGMEIYNHSGYLGGYEEDVGIIYDFMLRDGQKIYCFANDDNHNLKAPDDSFGGYNMIYADKLDYDSVFKAIKNGDFYASTGAEIKYIVYKDGKVYVGTEDAKYIRLTTNGRYSCFVTAEDKPLTEAVFNVDDEYITYFRITVKTINGAKAYSRAYFKNSDGLWE